MLYDHEICVFFQAEDGIRDLVRSRGLGDVYKRQVLHGRRHRHDAPRPADRVGLAAASIRRSGPGAAAVSYTHLTLPTSDLV